MQRGSSQHAGRLFRAIVANDEHLMIAHGIAATTAYEVLSSRVRGAIDHRGAVIRLRAAEYEHWRVALDTFEHAMREARDRGLDGIADLPTRGTSVTATPRNVIRKAHRRYTVWLDAC